MSTYIHVTAERRAVEPTRHGAHIMKEVVLQGGWIPPVTQIAFATLPEGPSDPEPYEHKTMWEVYLVMEGRAIYEIGEERVEVGPGDFLAIPPATMHRQVVIRAPHRIFYFGIATD